MSISPSQKIATRRLLAASTAVLVLIAIEGGLMAIAQSANAASDSRPHTSSTSTGPVAVAASRVYLVENATLHLTGEGETSLVERGSASGTFNSPVSADLNLSPGHVTGLIKIYPKGGSISGEAQARYVQKGSVNYYGGTLTITHGTGRYSHASGSSIDISGTISRLNFNLTVKAHGWANL